jgi:integrase/recombinase XerD
MTHLLPPVGFQPAPLVSVPDVGASQATFRARAAAVIARKYTSSETRRAYLRDLDDWLSFCADRGINPFLAEALAPAAYRELKLAVAAPGSVYRAMAALSAIYTGLRQEIPQLTNPFDGRFTARPDSSARHPRPAITPEQMWALMEACQREPSAWYALRDLGIFVFMWATGVRRAGLTSAELSDWKMVPGPEGQEEGEARVLVKGGKYETVRLPHQIAQVVRSWIEVRGPAPGKLFVRMGGHQMEGHHVYHQLKKRALQAGLDPKVVMPHGFRVGIVTRAFAEKLPPHKIQALVHHARIDTTIMYDRGERGAEVSRAVGQLPKAPAPKANGPRRRA